MLTNAKDLEKSSDAGTQESVEAVVKKSSGTKANLSGQKLEREINDILADEGFEIIRYKDYREAMLYETDFPKLAIRRTPYKSVFGHRSYIEFLLIIGEKQILLETKRQSSAGSHDEKLAYVYLAALKNIPERDYALVMEGEGWRDEARAWVEDKARITPGFSVIREEEFLPWLKLQVEQVKSRGG